MSEITGEDFGMIVEIKEMFEIGRLSARAIAEELDISMNKVVRTLLGAGYSRDDILRMATMAKLEQQCDDVVEAYEEGTPIRSILQEFGISRDQLFTLLEEEEVEIRKPNPKQLVGGRPVRSLAYQRILDEAVTWYKQGMLVQVICDELGISPRTLYDELKVRGVPKRRKAGGG